MEIHIPISHCLKFVCRMFLLLLQIEAAFVIQIGAKSFTIRVAVTNWGRFVTNWDSNYTSRQLLQIDAQLQLHLFGFIN